MNKLPSTAENRRIQALDQLRGFALLGILIMNIISFSNISGGYINPTVGAGIEGYNAYFHAFSYLFADMRFMGVFSLLFGAGIMLFTQNLTQKGKTVAAFHYKRMFFLLIFGLMHAYLIWMGDILVSYAICGSLIFLLRHWKSNRLLLLAGLLYCIPILFNLATYLFTPQEMLEKIFAFWTPSAEEINGELEAYRGSYGRQLPDRMAAAIGLQTKVFLLEYLWRSTAMMLIGMALFKKGILAAQKSKVFYQRMFGIGMGIGLLLSATSLYRSYASAWDGIWVMNVGHSYNMLAALSMSLAYVGLIMWWSKTDFASAIKDRLAAAGRMAFTNYILSSVICTFIFYGHGLGYFGMFDRLEQWGVVLLVWAIILLLSPIVLKKYRQGPLESLWRNLTYWGVK